MNFEKRLEKHIQQNLDKQVPNPYQKNRRLPIWARIMIPATAFALAAAFALPIVTKYFGNLENMIARLSGSFVDMEGVAGFAIGNAPSNGEKPKLKTMRFLNNNFSDESTPNGGDNNNSDNEHRPADPFWSDEDKELYDWESDYDWDPDKANVLFTLDEAGHVTEVVYERTNNRGQVRQNTLGNAAAMYVSKTFTYVMYVDDDEWRFWQEIDYAQELANPTGFHVHHDRMQTIVIHNETGKVFALKDLLTQVSDITGAKNYTMQARPTKDDFVNVDPSYGTFAQMAPLYFKVIYNDELDKVEYINVLPKNSGFTRTSNAKEDKYNQLYVLADDEKYPQDRRLDYSYEIAELDNYQIIGNTLITRRTNSIFYGSDNRAYAIKDGKLQVFKENFELSQIENTTVVNLEGMANEFFGSFNDNWLNGSCFHYENGYLFSAFGETWEVGIDGTLTQSNNLEGNFALYTNDTLMIAGKIVAFVNGREYLHYTVDGELVELMFSVKDNVPTCEQKHIIYLSEYWVSGHRLVALQDHNGGYGFNRGYTEYFLITAKGGKLIPQYIANGNYGGILGAAGTTSEPIDFSDAE